ncbi:transcription elongation factor Spt5 [Histomonas meleagridis]|uniref:transcription elongation factor Spt5 n=1 Tax=Histomonas meleagridis TaxID=135588 RepID=UPI003559D826|nr:transcription elongation factor Spt5 [Histomonas meleagridis]KAH0797636.1 transcription elongation factor Spt5 [Histomonas meleagridis]
MSDSDGQISDNSNSDNDDAPKYDDSNQPSHNPRDKSKKSMTFRDFVESSAEDDLESSNDSDEEFEEEENEEDRKFVTEEDVEDEGFTNYIRMNREKKKRRKSSHERPHKSYKEKSREIQDRFSGYVDRDVYEYVADTKALNTPIAQWRASLIPTAGEHRIFLIHTNPGKEYRVILNLTKKYYPGGQISEDQTFSNTVFSAFCPQPGSGIVYIEAMTSTDAKLFQNDIPDVLVYKEVLPIPYEEMQETISVAHRRIDIYPGEFVRIRVDHRNESYKGDLAQVINVNTNNDSVLVKLVPRIDYDELKNILEMAEKEEDQNAISIDQKVEGLQSKLNRLKGTKTYRPPQAEFNEIMVSNISKIEPPKEDRFPKHIQFKFDDRSYRVPRVVLWDNTYFVGTFAYKEYPINNVIHEDINPRQDEVKRFRDSLQANDCFEKHIPDFIEQMNISLGMPSSNKFNVHNIVRIMDGDYRGLIAEIVKIDKDIVTVRPINIEDGDVELSVELYMIQKYFKEGDHVKILSGEYAGQTGEVQVATDNIANVLLDSNHITVDVDMSNLVTTSDVFSEPKSIGKYALYDFVQLTDKSQGVIWRIENRLIYILLSNGESKQISLDNIDHRIDDRSRIARDETGKIINLGQMVQVKHENNTITALVKHISKDFIFLYDESNREYNGIFVTEPRQCKVNSNNKQQIAQPQMYRPNAKPRSVPNSEFKLGQCVIIKTGHLKGQLGDIKQIDQTSIRVLLHLKGNYTTLNINDRGKTWDVRNTNGSSLDSLFSSRSSQRQRQQPPQQQISRDTYGYAQQPPPQQMYTPYYSPYPNAQSPMGGNDRYYGYAQSPNYAQSPDEYGNSYSRSPTAYSPQYS